MGKRRIGVIGGSGLYEMEGLTDLREEQVTTPFGDPSANYIIGRLGDTEMVFLPRHGRGHTIMPSELNFRANIYGMKKLGVGCIISVSAVGSMKEEIVPGHIVIPDQFFDMTKGRTSTFFGDGLVGHVGFADPICHNTGDILFEAGQEVGATIHKGGTYICIEGPQFSSRAESNIYRKWGVDIIGMTNVTEAKLAREAEICYATVALSTDYDCWHESEEDVTVDAVIEIINQNVAMAKKIIKNAVGKINFERSCSCQNAAKNSIISNTSKIPEQTRKNLDLIFGKYL